jgi:Questin oxidase-like
MLNLEATLSRARGDSMEFPHLLANHAPMVLIALDRLGAGGERIDEWYWTYREANSLVSPPPPVAPIRLENWESALGDRTRESDYRALFVSEARRLGIDGVIRAYVPRLVQGVAGSALHPLMRLAYGVLKGDVDEVGTAIGYWAACHLPLPEPGASAPDTDDPLAVLLSVADIEGARTYETETDLLWHNIRAVAALPGFRPLVDRLAIGADAPRRMAETALAIFAATMDFSALHAVTGLHWTRLVAPHLDRPELLYRALWQVVAALVPKIGFPQAPSAEWLEEMRGRSAPEWPEIHAAAVASNDEHDVSCVFSAWQEEQVWRDRLYRVVAARRLGLVA